MRNEISRILAIALAVAIFATFASATTAVGKCRPDLASFDSFSDAIAGTPDGGKILVCPGNYAEQFTITKNLTITGISSGNSGLPAIVPPAAGLLQNIVTLNVPSGFLVNAFVAAQVIVNPGITATITNLTVDGTNNKLPNCVVPIGIFFNSSSGSVNHVAFRNQSAPCGSATNPYGDSVLVESTGVLPAVVSVLNSSFHSPGWMAVHAAGPGVNVSFKNNTAIGPGPTAGNGINVEAGAGASAISNNSISNDLGLAVGTGFWGILLNGCAGNSFVNGNTLSNTQIGIYITCPNNTVSNNTIFNTQLDGVAVCGNGNVVNANTINDSGRSGINVVQGCASSTNQIYNNNVDGACTGTLVGTDAVSNSIGPNTLFSTKFLALTGATCI